MKKIYFAVMGLMSLLALSSCEDKFAYYEENEFSPIGYQMKIPEGDDADLWTESSTVQVMGIKGLIIDEFDKSDWKIIAQSDVLIKGDKPLEIEKSIVIERIKDVIEVPTNYDPIPLAFTNTQVTYQYLGKEVVLPPVDEYKLFVRVEEDQRIEKDGFFFQAGNIVYSLMIGYVTVKNLKQPFIIANDANK